MKIKEIKELSNNELVIKWRITYDCNYQCSYCYQKTACNTDLGELDYLEIARKINTLIQKSGKKKVKLYLIGGEVTLLPLEDILQELPKIETLHITTNFSKNAEYFNNLRKYVKNLDVCFSFHSEYVSVNEFIEKLRPLDKKINKKVEMVFNDNTAQVNYQLIERLNELEIPYDCDKDKLSNVTVEIPESTTEERIKVTLENNKVKHYRNKNDLFYDKEVDCRDNKYLRLKGQTCSFGYSYLYIKGDKLQSYCDGTRTEIEDWQSAKRVCEKDGCTLCGEINITE